MPTGLVIPAAGSGQRFGGTQCKQLQMLADRPVLVRSIEPFVERVDDMVVVVNATIREGVAAAIAKEPWAGRCRLIEGGACRRDSVHNGLLALSARCTWALVHDAARPLVDTAVIDACLTALQHYPAVVAATPCCDTLKRVDNHPAIAATVPREGLWRAQTPQGLRLDLALPAFARARDEHWDVTDDVSVLERAGHACAVVPDSPRNLKITLPEDLALAAALLSLD